MKTYIYDFLQKGKRTLPMGVRIVSFGYKWGMPLDADLVFDVRFLPNPFYEDELKSLTGLDGEVVDYVFRTPASEEFLKMLTEFVFFLIPHFVSEGKMLLNVCIGCTGGKHRSVVIGNGLARQLGSYDVKVSIVHRDIDRE